MKISYETVKAKCFQVENVPNKAASKGLLDSFRVFNRLITYFAVRQILCMYSF